MSNHLNWVKKIPLILILFIIYKKEISAYKIIVGVGSFGKCYYEMPFTLTLLTWMTLLSTPLLHEELNLYKRCVIACNLIAKMRYEWTVYAPLKVVFLTCLNEKRLSCDDFVHIYTQRNKRHFTQSPFNFKSTVHCFRKWNVVMCASNARLILVTVSDV